MQVRRVHADDAPAVAVLLGELGYPATSEAVANRIAVLAGGDDDPAWVGLDGPGSADVVGFVAGHCFQPYELERPTAELTALVVAPGRRRSGLGHLLVETVQEWATLRGCQRLTVASALRRHDAHDFYRRCGFAERSRKFEREL